MSNSQSPGLSPYVTTTLMPASRPRMFNTRTAQVLWTLLPILTVAFAAAVPFVAAAVKGVVKPWIAGVYICAEIAVFGVVLGVADGKSPVPGFLLVLFITVAATHTSLMDSERVTVGKLRWEGR
ncbi:hypothetical protein [Streptomyces coffeae]|uniref:Uncharacterized protein n=1 Tax=Streptomyces coffeae TaxID=621382 RepID=A0ABS1NLU0_9ACTN|nr:hypothetical protein [Streptomyces coffeae]MBL1100867.1 hypothetical protein [Streptomyces coffeae]